MRRLICGLVITAIAALATSVAFAGDREIAQRIVTKLISLKKSNKLDNPDIGVQVKNGVAGLIGSVKTSNELAIVEQTVRDTQGVRRVINKLEVLMPGLVSQVSASPIQLQPGSLGKAVESSLRVRSVSDRYLPANTNSAASANSSGRSPVRLAVDFRRLPRTSMVRPAAALRRLPITSPRRVPRQVLVAMPSPLPLAIGQNGNGAAQQPIPAYMPGTGGITPVRYNRPHLPNYAWPTYASYPNYGTVTYPKQYSPTAWPYIGPFYPYPQVPLGWRKVQLTWDDGWWMLDFKQ